MEIIFIAVITAFVIFIFWDVNRLKHHSSCPKCKSKWSIREVDKISLGSNFRNGNSQNYRVYYKCNKCDHKWSEIKEIADKNRGRRF